MIEVHHLRESRSRRITWLLEELGVDYEVISYDRDPTTRLAPPELKLIHPLGKAPIIRDNDEVLFESGAIIEYLVRRYGNELFQVVLFVVAATDDGDCPHLGNGRVKGPCP